MNTMKRLTLKGLGYVTAITGILAIIIAIAAAVIIHQSGDANFKPPHQLTSVVNDITGLNPIHVAREMTPHTSQEIIDAINTSQGPISIGGGRFSMGGQVAFEDSLHLDMRQFNRVLNFNAETKTITVQSGITWRDLQAYIDPHNLSVRIMQTYANFTVGGSISVNVHGRYIGEGPLVKSVISLKVVLANGEELYTDRQQHSDIFYALIGGYGGIGVITEATLKLADNVKVERQTRVLNVNDYAAHFANDIRDNPDVVFHNGDLYPPDYQEVRDVTWYQTDKPLTVEDRLRDKDASYTWQVRAAEFVADSAIGKAIRQHVIDPVYYAQDKVVWRNWEASYDVRELEPKSRADSTYVLREYFVPVGHFDAFVARMKEIFTRHQVNIINVSIRHALPAPETPLSWAREEVFAFVVYYKQGTDKASVAKVGDWSVEMIDAVIAEGGAYYLPYQIFASTEQFMSAYPNAGQFFALKAKLDPQNRFRNQLWKQHYHPDSSAHHQTDIDSANGLAQAQQTQLNSLEAAKQGIAHYHRGEEQTMLTIPEWYLVFNPVEYADYLESGQAPDQFPFMASINEYWTLYDKSVAYANQYGVDNSEYMTMLQVIGVSTTVEYMVKAAYETVIGQFSRWTASDDTPEDELIYQAQRAYSQLIFDKAWYEFDFGHWVWRMWHDNDFWGDNFIRKTERKLFFTMEFGFKALYAKVIGFASQTAYEPENGLIYLTATIPDASIANLPVGVTVLAKDSLASSSGPAELARVILSVPRWGPFTKAIPKLVELGVQFEDISGNRQIALSYLLPAKDDHHWTQPASNDLSISDADSLASARDGVALDSLSKGTALFQSTLVSNDFLQRTVQLVPVTELSAVIEELYQKNMLLEHIYDY